MDVPSDAKKNTKKRLVMIILLVVILAIVVAGAIVLAVHLTKHHSADDLHVCHATYHESGQDAQEQTVTLTSTEVEFTTDNITVIFDFSTGLSTYKIESKDYALEECFVISLNMTQTPTLHTLREMYTTTNANFQTDSVVFRNFEVTQVWLNDIALGERAKNACKGKTIYFLIEIPVSGELRRKRGGVISWDFNIWKLRVKGSISW